MRSAQKGSFICEKLREVIFGYGDATVDTPSSALTQIPTHFRESPLVCRGANSSGLRVFSDFRGQNRRETLAVQGIGASEQLITRRPQVRVLPPQP